MSSNTVPWGLPAWAATGAASSPRCRRSWARGWARLVCAAAGCIRDEVTRVACVDDRATLTPPRVQPTFIMTPRRPPLLLPRAHLWWRVQGDPVNHPSASLAVVRAQSTSVVGCAPPLQLQVRRARCPSLHCGGGRGGSGGDNDAVDAAPVGGAVHERGRHPQRRTLPRQVCVRYTGPLLLGFARASSQHHTHGARNCRHIPELGFRRSLTGASVWAGEQLG